MREKIQLKSYQVSKILSSTLSIRELARKMNVSPTVISRILSENNADRGKTSKWTNQDNEFLLENYEKYTIEEMSKFMHRSQYSLTKHMQKLRLPIKIIRKSIDDINPEKEYAEREMRYKELEKKLNELESEFEATLDTSLMNRIFDMRYKLEAYEQRIKKNKYGKNNH